MAVYDWPYGVKAFWPRAARWRTLINERATVSALSGYTQTGSTPGARWGVALDFAAQSYAERRTLKGWIDRLQGNKNRVGMFDPAQPVPAGTVTLSGVALSASAAQFATSLQLSGCLHIRNLLLGAGFELDSNADGTADGLTAYNAGTSSGLAYSRVGGNGSTYAQRVSASSLGSASGDQVGFRWTTAVAVTADVAYTMAADLYATSGTSVSIEVNYYNVSNVIVGAPQKGTWAGNSVSYDRRSLTSTAPAGAVTAVIYVYMHSNSAGAPDLRVDNAQFEASATATAFGGPATILAGDWLGASTGQLLSVVTDVTADDLGRATVEVVQPLRSALASASAITLDKPRTPMVLQLSNGATPEIPFDGNGLAPPFTLELVEGWTA